MMCLRRAASVCLAILLSANWLAVAGAQAPAASSTAPATAGRAKELIGLLQARKIEAFAVRDTSAPGRYVGLLLIPGAQLLVVSAKHARSTDVEYYLYNKDYLSAYRDLHSSINAQEKVIIEDTLCDGLVSNPVKGALGRDTYTNGGEPQVFDGEFADPRKRNDKRIAQAEYDRVFSEAEASYTRLLELVIAELKKTAAPVSSGARMR